MRSQLKNMDDYIIPLSRFNKGEGGQILKEVKAVGAKAIFRNNKREAIIMAPEVYDRLMDMLYDYRVEEIARERLKNRSGKKVTLADVMDQGGFTSADLEGWEDVEIE